MKKLNKIILALTVMLLLISCNKSENIDSKTIYYRDSIEREVEIPKKIEKISPSGPIAEQVLISIAPEKMVSITKKSNNEDISKVLGNVNKLVESGQFFGKEPFNPETIATVDPDIIIDIGEKKKNISEGMNEITEKTGKPAVYIEMNFKDGPSVYKKLGDLLNEEDKGNKLSNYTEKILKEFEEGMNKVEKKKTYIYLSGKSGLQTNAKGSFQTQLLDMVGENVLVVDENKISSKGGSNEVSYEELLKLDPDIIIFGPGSIYNYVDKDPKMSQLRAIKNKMYVEVPFVPYNWVGFPPSSNCYMGCQWAAKLFYPEIFSYDLEERAKEYYKLFYSYDLSSGEYNNIIKNGLFKIDK